MDVVTAVGSFHSGKSFMLNTFMHSNCPGEVGFGIGNSVAATTMGIWAWSNTIIPRSEKTNTDGTPILILDTEGFGALNVSSDYDSKIFALSSLISNHLLYNSMKNVHSDAVDYLEVLAHKAQLFHVKTSLQTAPRNGGMGVDSSRPALAFPELTWCVQDWTLDWTTNYPDATTYIKGMIDGSRREDSADDIDAKESGLSSLFPHVTGHILHPPTTQTRDLAKLSTLTYKNLDELYLQDIENLREIVFKSLARDAIVRDEAKRILRLGGPEKVEQALGLGAPKVTVNATAGKNGTTAKTTGKDSVKDAVTNNKDAEAVVAVNPDGFDSDDSKGLTTLSKYPIDIIRAAIDLASVKNSMLYRQRSRTGPELVQLLRILVDAANNGAMPSLPSSWAALANQAATAAKEASVTQFNTQKRSLIREYDPFPTNEFINLLAVEREKALALYDHLVAGLRGAAIRNKRAELVKALAGETDIGVADNRRSIETFTRKQGDSFKQTFETYLKTLTIPQPSAALAKIIRTKKEEVLTEYKNKVVARYKEDAKIGISTVDSDLEKIGQAFIGKNDAELKTLLIRAENEGVHVFTVTCERELAGKDPQTIGKMKTIKEICIKAGQDKFADEGRIVKEESTFATHKNSLAQRMSSKWEKYNEENEKRLQEFIVVQAKSINDKLKEQFKDAERSIPADKETAINIKKSIERNAKGEYDALFTVYEDSPLVKNTWTEKILNNINILGNRFDEKNKRKWDEIFEKPITAATRDVLVHFKGNIPYQESEMIEYARSAAHSRIHTARNKVRQTVSLDIEDENPLAGTEVTAKQIDEKVNDWLATDRQINALFKQAWIRRDNQQTVYMGAAGGIVVVVALLLVVFRK